MRLINFLLIGLLLAAFSPARAEDAPPMVESARSELLLYAMSLIGVNYKPGGLSPQTGMDCSGFVRHVYGEAAGMQLPRDARAISKRGEEIGQPELRPGDLVFFNTMKRAFSHVGIYLGENRFIHASSSKSGGVMISDMGERYWSQRYNGARRLVNARLAAAN